LIRRVFNDESGYSLVEVIVSILLLSVAVIRTSGKVKPASFFEALRFRSPLASMHRLSARHAQDFNYLRGLPDQISQILN
jgi:hypothetical protein